MSHFNIRNGHLFCDDADLSDVASKNMTPFYVYSAAAFRENFLAVRDAFAAADPIVCYSVKSNGSLAVMKLLHSLGSGFDVVSGGEIYKCRTVHADMSKVVYAGVGKRDDEIEDGLRAGILMFHCESMPEIRRISGVGRRLGKIARIAVRVNPDVDAGTHHYITTAKKENKFGISFKDLKSHLDEIRGLSNIEFCGIHMHLGSQIVTVRPYAEAVAKGVEYVRELRRKGFRITHFNIGGGFGIIYQDEKPAPLSEVAKAVISGLKGLDLRLILEPGRFISGNAGALVTQVLYVKRGGKKTFLITDAGMNNLIRPSLYGAYHEITPLETRAGAKKVKVDVVGPICESGDFFAKDRVLPEVAERGYLAVLNAGAYGAAMASQYNAQPFAAELLVGERGKVRVIRRRESYSDMRRNEVI